MADDGSTEHRDDETEPESVEEATSPGTPSESDETEEQVSALDPEDEETGGTDLAGIATGLDILGNINTADMLGVSEFIRSMQRSMLQEIEPLRQSILGNINPVLPAIDAMQAVLGSAAFDTVRAVQLSGVTSLIETMQAQQALMVKQMLPTFSVLDTIAPALQQLSGIAEVQRSIIASSAIQHITAQPVVDIGALLDVSPPRSMMADIISAADLTKNLDLSSLLPAAFGFSSLRVTARAATAAQQGAAAADEDHANEAAIQAVLDAIEEDLDPDAPPTPEQNAALHKVAELVAALHPRLRDEFSLRAWGVGAATGTSFYAFLFFALANPQLFATLMLVASVATGARWVHSRSSDLLLPPGVEPD